MDKALVIIASGNKDKMREIQQIFRDRHFEVKRAMDVGPVLDVVEDGTTFAENAYLKAKAYHDLYPDAYVLADDSGLEVDPLGGRPGIYSARYGGVDWSYEDKSKLLWEELRKTGLEPEDWTARFRCAICFWEKGKEEPKTFEGAMEGLVIPERRGENGFGYDPLFFLPQYGKTSAEISPDLKNKISHRANALAKLEAYLNTL